MAPQTYQLVMRTGPTPGKIFPLEKEEVIIGRDPSDEVVINDAEVSRKHARLVQQGGGYVVEDLGSTNGTFVDGQRLMGPYTLRPGDLILLGENVSLAYEQTQFDPNATMVSGAGPASSYQAPAPSYPEVPPPPVQSFEAPAQQPVEPAPPPPPPPQAPQPVYQPPQQEYAAYTPPPPPPVAEYEAPPKKSSTRNWILAGCGCLILLIVLCAVAFYFFDAYNLYCPVLGFGCP